jgi:WD40 repeat protein
MGSWSSDDKYAITAGSDQTIRIWDPHTGDCVDAFDDHQKDVFVLEAHPTNPRLLLTAGYDGLVFIWDLVSGRVLSLWLSSFFLSSLSSSFLILSLSLRYTGARV